MTADATVAKRLAPGDPATAAQLTAWEEKTFSFLAAMGFRPDGATLVLAVSGGADSMALLEFWARAGAARCGCRLAAVHVHHGLRAAADLDQALVEARCRALGVPLRVFRLDPASRRSGESVEMWGRRERYRCFEAVAADLREPSGPVFVLTAHHRDDLVETVFQRLGRGTGVRGLGGIPFRREPDIVRPFLDKSREEIEAYLAGIGGAWREDETNGDPAIDRNWYRHRLLPAWREREAGLDERLLALALRVQGIGDGLLALEDEAGLIRRDAAGEAFLSAEAVEERLADGDFVSLRHWLGRLAGAVTGGKATIGEEMMLELRRQWRLGTRKLRVSAGAGAWLERQKLGIYWKKPEDRRPSGEARGKKGCPGPGQRIILDNGHGSAAWAWSGKHFTLTVRRYARLAGLRFPAAGEGRAIFDADLISCTLLVRTRKDGDRFSPLGVRSESRKLKVFLSEEKIPVGIRDEIPLVFSVRPRGDADGAAGDETLAWVPGQGISEFFKVGPETARILEMELTCRNP